MWDKLLKRGFIVYICLTPIEYGLQLFGDSMLKYFGYALIAVWLFPLKGKVPNLKKNKEILFLIIYLILGVFSILWSKDSEMGSYYILAMINMVLLISIASTLSWNKKDIHLLLLAFQISAAVFSLLLISRGQLYQGFRSTLVVNGQEQDPNNFSAMLAIPTLISLWKILNKRYIVLFHRNSNILNYLCLGFNIIAMLMLGSRGGLFGLLCGALFLVFLNNRFASNNKVSQGKLLAPKVILLIAVFLFFIFPYLDQQTLQRLSTERIKQDKGSDRLLIWDIALTQFSNAPLLGMGVGSFQGVSKMGVHNQFIIVLVESGIIGLVLFLIPLIVLFKKTWKNKVSLLPAILIATFIVIFFLDAYNKKYFWNAILLSVILLKMAKNNKKLCQSKIINNNVLNENFNL